ncbi:MAG: hypothetical protein E2O77_11700 [Caldithrix sp.]|nr:MAG: hypothetical protein E2O77_11700 [Caldithrix sp.]
MYKSIATRLRALSLLAIVVLASTALADDGNNNLPTVAIHDLVIHPRDGDLIAGTHGRSFWVLDDITLLQKINE